MQKARKKKFAELNNDEMGVDFVAGSANKKAASWSQSY
jgi:hypothetical protein